MLFAGLSMSNRSLPLVSVYDRGAKAYKQKDCVRQQARKALLISADEGFGSPNAAPAVAWEARKSLDGWAPFTSLGGLHSFIYVYIYIYLFIYLFFLWGGTRHHRLSPSPPRNPNRREGFSTLGSLLGFWAQGLLTFCLKGYPKPKPIHDNNR